jgi:glyceraldehyde 3-phosphate dehydrogenase
MALRIGINGFGRIGRNVLRAGWDQEGLEFVHLNDLTSADSLAYLLQHDSVHGGWKSVKAVDGGLEIDGRLVRVSAEREPGKLPWGEAGVDVVLECTGRFTEGPKAQPHRDAGAPKVIISAPASKVDATFVVGVNHGTYDRAAHHIVSNASCTTNCLAPLAKVLHETVGIERGLMTTVHSYTMDQNLLDAPHKDFRRSRAAALNMVPTSTGAAKAIGLVLPAIAGRLNGVAIRVPTPNGSLVDLTFTAERPTTKEEINDALRAAAAGPLKGILEATDAPIVSSDIIGNPHSSIADLALTDVIGGTLVKVFAWYDNEWGFSNRMLDLARIMVG